MAHRIEVVSKVVDARAEVKRKKIQSLGFNVESVELVDNYTLDGTLSPQQLNEISSAFANPVSQDALSIIPFVPPEFDYAIEIGFHPGVTDNVGNTCRECTEDRLGIKLEGQGAYSSQTLFVTGEISREEAVKIGESLANPLIQRIKVRDYREVWRETMGRRDPHVPRVNLTTKSRVDLVGILDASDDQLTTIGKQGIANADGTRRGPLALDLAYMKAIQKYFLRQGRDPTDVELESIAQTWSEHCKHTIFGDPIDEIQEGLYSHYIKRATNEIRRAKGDRDFCVSVFTDNAGAIVFDENFLVTDKAETHNSPSALDPFGGSVTGIVGVNRDAIGFGLGAKPIINGYGFCFGDPDDIEPIFKDKDLKQKMLSPRRIMDGVIDGVNFGGNCSGIPTDQGFLYFDKRYKGKPLVFVRTDGLIPREVNGRKMYEKQAMPGDYVVMIGGRVGKDGIHGATFSSEAIDSGSPATAVQIGDPITQKKLSDAVVKEARDLGLYRSMTDDGAGGLSCSVPEMAKESGGCRVDLDKVPVKYPGLQRWEIWVSESQERMTLAVPPENWDAFSELMKRRGVEATIIGEFTNSGKCIVEYGGERVMDVDMDFLHDGLPARPMKTVYQRPVNEEPNIPRLEDLTDSLYSMLARRNIASKEFVSRQYDHEVQGGSVIKPLQGRGRVNGKATVTKPLLGSDKAVVLSQGINPSYSDIDTYHMAACAIDSAIANAVAVGADMDHLALMDNFCWCSSNDPQKLGELKEAAKACYDYAVAYGTPFISGKDSMFNDFKGYDKDGKPIKISIPPTLMVSSISVMRDARRAVSMETKFAGDIIYVLGETREELGGSEYFAMMGEKQRGEGFIGNNVPKVDAAKNDKTYRALSTAIQEEIVSSAHSVGFGGLAVALAETAIGGQLGMEVSIDNLPGTYSREDYALYSQSQGRFVVTIAPQNREKFEKIVGSRGVPFSRIGEVRADSSFVIKSGERNVVQANLEQMTESYKSTFRGY